MIYISRTYNPFKRRRQPGKTKNKLSVLCNCFLHQTLCSGNFFVSYMYSHTKHSILTLQKVPFLLLDQFYFEITFWLKLNCLHGSCLTDLDIILLVIYFSISTLTFYNSFSNIVSISNKYNGKSHPNLE